MLGSPGLGWVDLFSDQRSECPHSGHCQREALWEGMVVKFNEGNLFAVLPLNLILRFGVGNCLPLHIAGIICAAARQRLDVIHDVARSAVWIPGLTLEFFFGRCASVDPPTGITATRRGNRAGRGQFLERCPGIGSASL
jgi:hypothetical protein